MSYYNRALSASPEVTFQQMLAATLLWLWIAMSIIRNALFETPATCRNYYYNT